MGRAGQQLMKRVASEPATIEPNLVTVESRLNFSSEGPLAFEACWDMLRLLVRLDDEAAPPGEWAALPCLLRAGLTKGRHLELPRIPMQIVEWLRDRQDDYTITVIALAAGPSNASLLADLAGCLRTAPGEFHVVTERPLTSAERRLMPASVVLAPPGRTQAVAAQLFTMFASDAAEVHISCRDLEDCRQAYGTPDAPSRMVEAWWDDVRSTFEFADAADRSSVASSKVVIASLYLDGGSRFGPPMKALREMVDDEDAWIAFGSPLDFLEPTGMPGLMRVHLLCSLQFPRDAAMGQSEEHGT